MAKVKIAEVAGNFLDIEEARDGDVIAVVESSKLDSGMGETGRETYIVSRQLEVIFSGGGSIRYQRNSVPERSCRFGGVSAGPTTLVRANFPVLAFEGYRNSPFPPHEEGFPKELLHVPAVKLAGKGWVSRWKIIS